MNKAKKVDGQGFDEIRIVTVPRYKTSGLSGNEWRYSAEIQLMRKGKVIKTERRRNVEIAARHLSWVLDVAGDEGNAFYGGGENGTCDQEGCAEQATVTLKLKKVFGRDDYEGKENIDGLTRQFCERHSTRGDCALEDSDDNYEVVSGEKKSPRDSDESESVFGGVINLN